MKTSKFIKRLVRQRANSCCEYCLSPVAFSPDPFAADHVIPRIKGGGDNLDNLAFSCHGCNGHKFAAVAASDPVTYLVVPLYHPRQDVWNEHFEWSADFTQIVGITPIGRATINRLQLNRSNVVNLLKALIAFGKHPPVLNKPDLLPPHDPTAHG